MSNLQRNKYGVVVNNDESDLIRYKEQIARVKTTKNQKELESRIVELEQKIAALSQKVEKMVGNMNG